LSIILKYIQPSKDAENTQIQKYSNIFNTAIRGALQHVFQGDSRKMNARVYLPINNWIERVTLWTLLSFF